MNCFFEIPLWAVIAFTLSIVGNALLLFFYLPVRRANRNLMRYMEDLQQQVNDFRKIADNCQEIVRLERDRCVFVLHRVLTEREKEEVSEDREYVS